MLDDEGHAAVAPEGKMEHEATFEPSKGVDDSKNEKSIVPKRIIRRRRRKEEDDSPPVDSILLQHLLKESQLPPAYSFEIPKTIQRINSLKATHVALQMPEGLLIYASVLADLLKRLAPALSVVSILGDVTYGACCVDDLGAQALGAQMLVHYGHSCLVPLQHTVVPCLYVFVEIQIDISHMCDCLMTTLGDDDHHRPLVYLLGTVQFRHAFGEATELLEARGCRVHIPQIKPLSPGEVLGCTSPKLDAHGEGAAIVCFVADGRFHLESTLISNPHVQTFYRYDPYGKTLTVEEYAHEDMKHLRWTAIQRAQSAQTFGVILGTLGRQGNPAIVQRLRRVLTQHDRKHFLLLLSEITPHKLHLMSNNVDAWVQVACPRLSVDWGHFLSEKPVLTPYELFCCLGETSWRDVYPMDYYSQTGGIWSNYNDENKNRKL